MKDSEQRRNQSAVGWAIVGGVVGSFFGIAGFGGAISGAVPGAILGWFVAFSLLSTKK